MAHRRMISLEIVDTDSFSKMSQDARYLYFELVIRADDDGFLGAPMRIVRMVGCTEKDLDELVDNLYIIRFETGIIVIRDWKIHNNVRKDMYKKTIYQKELDMLYEVENRYYLKGVDNVTYNVTDDVTYNVTDDVTYNVTDDVTYNVTLGKDRLGKDSIGKDRLGKVSIDYQQIADMYNNTCVSFPRLSKLSESRKKAIKARLQTYSVEDFQRMFEMAEGSSFLKGANNRNWSATFDWMVKDANMAKILDGNYQDRQSEPQIPEKTPEEIEREKREEQEALDRIEMAEKREYVYDPEHPFQ